MPVRNLKDAIGKFRAHPNIPIHIRRILTRTTLLRALQTDHGLALLGLEMPASIWMNRQSPVRR
jgi:hypothetical protein